MRRLLLAVAVLAAGCSGDDTPVVRVAEVERTTVAETVDAPGSVGARSSATVTAPTDARVEQVLVQDGATVTAGAVLVRLSSRAAQERLRQARAAQASAAGGAVDVPRAELSPLQDALDAAAAAAFAAGRAAAAQIDDPQQRRQAEQRVAQAERQYRAASAAARRTLADVNRGAQSLEDALAAVAGSQRAQARVAVSAAQATVDALTVRAPISGVVTLGGDGGAAPAGGDLAGLLGGLPPGLADSAGAALGPSGPATTSAGLPVGAQVRSGATLLTLTDVGGLTVTAEVDETDVLLVKTGQSATVELDAVPDATYPATVAAVDVTPTPSAGGGVTYRVRLSLAGGRTAGGDPAPKPRPGMSAVVDLQVRTAEQVLAVPSAAVVRDQGKDTVFVVEDGRAQRVEVTLGAQGEDSVEVTRGLSGGEQVVVRDADRLTDGQAVET